MLYKIRPVIVLTLPLDPFEFFFVGFLVLGLMLLCFLEPFPLFLGHDISLFLKQLI